MNKKNKYLDILRKYNSMIYSFIIIILEFVMQTFILQNSVYNGFNVLILVVNPILASLLGIIISKNKNLLGTLIGQLLITLFTYKEFYGKFDKYIIILSIIYLILSIAFIITKTSLKRKYIMFILLSLMSIFEYLIFSYTNFDNLNNMLFILLIIINPIFSILTGIMVSKEKNLFWSLICIFFIPISTYILLFTEKTSDFELPINIIIYSAFYLLLSLIIIISNKLIKIKKVKLSIITILIVLLLILSIFITNTKDVINNINYNMHIWYHNYTAKVVELNDKKITLQLSYYENDALNYSSFEYFNDYKIKVQDVNVGDVIKIASNLRAGIGYEESIITKKDDQRKLIEFTSLYRKNKTVSKECIKSIIDQSGKKIKYNEIELNQEIKILYKLNTLKVSL